MKKTNLCAFALLFSLLAASFAWAGNDGITAVQYQKIDNETREMLKKCLDNKSQSIENCVKHAKKHYKIQKKTLKYKSE